MRGHTISILLLLVLTVTTNGLAQSVNFQDGFEDGDFSDHPAWHGDTDQFTVVDGDPNYLLQLDAASSPAYLSTPSANITGSWEFFIKFSGFEPSGSNRATIFLMSDIANLEGSVNGYAVEVGQRGDDFFRIVRYDKGSKAATILTDTTVVRSGAGYTIKVSRSKTGHWQMEVGRGYGGPLYNSGNTGTDHTYTSASFFGAKVNFTSSRSDKFFFDFKIDLPPFVTTMASASGDQTIDVAFNRAVDQPTVGNRDFSLNHGLGAPVSISFPSADTVRLIYDRPLPSNKYVLSVDGISDRSGNPIVANDRETFTIFGTYSDGDVKINEFMYDPPGGQAEYIELKNTGNKYLNLSNWQIGDDSNKDILYAASIPLQPHSLLVISADTSALFNSYGPRNYRQADRLPSLNNSGDAIRILTDTGTLVDSLSYKPDWGGQNVALERRSISAPTIYPENWGNAPNSDGGTPGLPNEVAADTRPPRLTSFNIISDKLIALGFDERLDTGSASDIPHYRITNSNIISAQVTAPDTVQLSLGSNLKNAQSYALTISGAKDIFGNAITQIDTSFTYYKVSPADSGDVAINEFMYAPASGTEYIELYNHSGKSLDLQNWTLSDNRHQPTIITDSKFVVPPDSFAILAPDNSLRQYFPDISLIGMGDRFPALNNGGDQIIIRDNHAKLLDSLAYNSGWGGDEVALERRSTALAANYKENWGDSPNGFGTPGNQNEVAPDRLPPSLKTFAIQDNRTITLRFSERLKKSAARDENNYKLSKGIGIDKATISAPDSISLSLDGDLKNDTRYILSLRNISDIFGNAIAPTDTSFTYYKISAVDSGDVFINEFSYDPAGDGTEYVELYNPTDRSYDLKNWTLSDNRELKATVTTTQFVVPPDSFVVIAPDHSMLTTEPGIALVAMSDFPSLNNRGDDIILRDANGLLIDSLQYSSAWGGSEVALERRTVSAPAIYRENWGDSPGGGTPGRANNIAEDKTPPQLTSLHIIGNKKLELGFDERIENNAARTTNYTITHSAIDSAGLISADSVFLALKSPLQNARDYTLSLSGLKDIFGNAIPKTDTTFTFYETSPVDSGDIAINEFMYLPPPGSTEYIELYNHSEKSLNLKKWSFSDNRHLNNPIIQRPFIIPPDSFVVLAPDNTILQDYPDINLISMGSSFPALNNSSDQIIIRDSTGTLLDSLRYSSIWGGNEVALERKTTSVAGAFSENWGKASNGFGTPGSANSIPADTTPPTLRKWYPVDASTVQLTFSERIALTSTALSHYSISSGIGIQLISVKDDTVTLYLNQSLSSGQTYNVTVSNISDIFGNILSTATKNLKFIKIDEAQPADIVLNEIMYNPAPGEADFVELYNTSDNNIDLRDWFIGDATGATQIGKSVILGPDSYLVLTGNQTFARNYDNAIPIADFPSLNDYRGDAVYIQRKDGTTIDSLYYSRSWGGQKQGTSMERRDPRAASNDASNWTTSSSSGGYSAGQQNVSFHPDTDPPSVIFANISSNGDYEIRFNEFIKRTPGLTFFSGGKRLTIIKFDSTRANLIRLNSAGTNSNKKETKITVRHLSDIKGNTRDKAKIAVAKAPGPADLVINEIMYDPLNDANDNLPDQSEYIELHNTRDYAISLEGLRLHDAPDEHGDVRTLQPVTSTAKWVPARGYTLIYADEAPQFTQSRLAQYFELKPPGNRSILRVDRSSLSLASTGDAIYLADSTGASIDSVYYDESWQNPNLMDTKGIALERIDPNGPSDNDTNWGSSVAPKGGTPGKENSIYQTDKGQTVSTGISFNPNPFSPDDDGYDDNLFINYKLDQQDYLIRLRIYDRYGRLVRELADGKPAGFEGQLIWDGRKDDGGRNRIGIYIVVFEAYDSATGDDVAFKKTVVLARKLN